MSKRAPCPTRTTPVHRPRTLKELLLMAPNELMVHRPRTLQEFILILPDKLKVQILANVFRLPGGVRRVQWDTRYCRKSESREARLFCAEELVSDTIIPFPSSLDPLGRTAKEAFYQGNTFCLARTRLARQTCFEPTSFWLPRADTRCWIRCLEVVVRIAPLRTSTYFPFAECRCPLDSRYTCKHSDWPFLRRLESGVYGFTALETLGLIFEGAKMTAAELRAFDRDLNRLGPFIFKTDELRVRADICISGAGEAKQSGSVRPSDKPLTAMLLQHMSATSPSEVPPDSSSPDEKTVPRPDSPEPDGKDVPQKGGFRKKIMVFAARFRTEKTLHDKDSGTSKSSS